MKYFESASQDRIAVAAARKRRQRRRFITSPSNFTATADVDEVQLSWGASIGLYVDGYKVFRNDTEIANIQELTYTDTLLIADTEYVYSVYAYNKYNGQSESATVTTTTLSLPFP